MADRSQTSSDHEDSVLSLLTDETMVASKLEILKLTNLQFYLDHTRSSKR